MFSKTEAHPSIVATSPLGYRSKRVSALFSKLNLHYYDCFVRVTIAPLSWVRGLPSILLLAQETLRKIERCYYALLAEQEHSKLHRKSRLVGGTAMLRGLLH